MKIIYYEMRKSWLKIPVALVLLLFTALDFYKIYSECKTHTFRTGAGKNYYYELYGELCGKLDDRKLDNFIKKADSLAETVGSGVYSLEYDESLIAGNIFAEYMLFDIVIRPEIVYCTNYAARTNSIAAAAVENYRFYTAIGKTYEARKNAMIYSLYFDRSITEYRSTFWASEFFDYDFSSLLVIILVILGLSSGFTVEKSNKMNSLIGAYGGYAKTTAAKTISAAVYSLVLTVYFTAFDLAALNVIAGVDGIKMPLYSIQTLSETPFEFSILTAILLCGAAKFLGTFALSLLILILSKVSSNTVISTALSFGAALVLIALTGVKRFVFNPITALSPADFIRDFDVVDVFGYPVLSIYFEIAAVTILCAGLTTVLAFFAGRKNNALS